MTWTTDAYFAKAQAYWERATSRGRENEDFLLNVCFTIEFATRGALCYVNPALNAADDVESLLFACGQTPRTPARTADWRDVLKRLQRLLPTLTDAEVTKVNTLVSARNAELHGDTAELSQLPAEGLMPSVYSYLVKVTDFAHQDLNAVLGPSDAGLAKRTAEAMTKDRSKRVKSLIDVCKERFFSLSELEQQTKRDAAATDVISAVLHTGQHIMYLKCPACAQKGRLVAAPVGKSAAFLHGDELVQEVRVAPFQFTCGCCGLDINGLDELMAAGFAHEYRSLDDVDPIDHFNIDPNDYVDHEAIAREYHRDMYEYQDE